MHRKQPQKHTHRVRLDAVRVRVAGRHAVVGHPGLHRGHVVPVAATVTMLALLLLALAVLALHSDPQ
jgi:hypothetical protein